MACGGCAKKRQLALRQSTGSVEPAQPPRETKIQCPACGAMHSQVEYIQCSFRLQQERQRAREMRLKAKLLKPEVEKPTGIETRRGRQIQTQFPALQTIIPIKKKW